MKRLRQIKETINQVNTNDFFFLNMEMKFEKLKKKKLQQQRAQVPNFQLPAKPNLAQLTMHFDLPNLFPFSLGQIK